MTRESKTIFENTYIGRHFPAFAEHFEAEDREQKGGHVVSKHSWNDGEDVAEKGREDMHQR